MRRDDVRRTLVPPEKELPLPLGRCSQTCDIGTKPDLVVDRDRQQQHQQPLVVLVAEDQLFTIEAKREVLRKNRLAAIEACCAVRNAVPYHWGLGGTCGFQDPFVSHVVSCHTMPCRVVLRAPLVFKAQLCQICFPCFTLPAC